MTTPSNKKRWQPCIDGGYVGEMGRHMRPPATDEAFGGNLRPITATDDGITNKKPVIASSEKMDDDMGPAQRYCNPAGFVGLHRNVRGQNEWFKTGGQREVKRQIMSLDKKNRYSIKGAPLK
jgi:hypothetical protein